jgi:hypothetical protein
VCKHLHTLLFEYFLCFEKMKANLCDNIAVCSGTLPLQSAGIVEPEEMAAAGQRLGNDVSVQPIHTVKNCWSGVLYAVHIIANI